MVGKVGSGHWRHSILGAALLLGACSGGGGSGGSPGSPPPPPPPPPPPADGSILETQREAARFLNQATFGGQADEITALTGQSASNWFVEQVNMAPTLSLPYVQNYIATVPTATSPDGLTYEGSHAATFAFWVNAIESEDQLRQRMAFALSQVLVISSRDGGTLAGIPTTVAYYQDILARNAFGNYRDVLEDVTYSPAMAEYLTYMTNIKGDPDTGRMPDENYARELMQLFTIGLVELNRDGTVRTDASGEPISTYGNADVQGLAKVFTGLSVNQECFFCGFYEATPEELISPISIAPQWHSELEKSFLGTTIAANTDAATSIDTAIDTLFNHPNLPPFLSRQLIQRFVTSDPDPAYVDRVASTFESGSFVLPNNQRVGTGQRGDLAATLAAVLFDEAARNPSQDDQFGKVREPVVRFVHWARAFDATGITPQYAWSIWDAGRADALAQGPYKSPSVFNFYRPGYVAPGTESGAAGMTVPELQIVNAGTVTSYANFMAFYIFNYADQYFEGPEAAAFYTAYTDEIAMANDPAALVDHLDILLTNGALAQGTRDNIIAAVTAVPEVHPYDPEFDTMRARAQLAVYMVMTSPDYLVLR
ncbi:MAG: DUF1800 domain-containing protein [Pseudomonadota bacterium]